MKCSKCTPTPEKKGVSFIRNKLFSIFLLFVWPFLQSKEKNLKTTNRF